MSLILEEEKDGEALFMRSNINWCFELHGVAGITKESPYRFGFLSLPEIFQHTP